VRRLLDAVYDGAGALAALLMIGLLMFVFAIALALVRDAVTERSAYRQAATAEVSAAHAGAQTISGPVLWLPYTETSLRTVKVEGEGNTRLREEAVTEERVAVVFPQKLDTRSQLSTEQRQRGIFPVTVYSSQHRSSARFVWAEIKPRATGGKLSFGQPLLLMGVSDARGLLSAPRLKLADQNLALERAPAAAPLPLAAPVNPALLRAGEALRVEVGDDGIHTQHQHTLLVAAPGAGVARGQGFFGLAAAQHTQQAGAIQPDVAAVVFHTQRHAVELVVLAFVGAGEALAQGCASVARALQQPPQAADRPRAQHGHQQHRDPQVAAEQAAPAQHGGDHQADHHGPSGAAVHAPRQPRACSLARPAGQSPKPESPLMWPTAPRPCAAAPQASASACVRPGAA
jgi:hypothetical protein